MGSRRVWWVFGVGVFAYLITVMQRSTLGVAAVDATERFQIDAAALSTLAVAQLIVYAAMQVPVGVLIDRLGPRVLILAGLAVVMAGQVWLGLTTELGGAIVGRMLVGLGDAAVFTSVLRLVNSWFPTRRVPIVSQWVGNIGQIGQILSAVPFSFVLHAFGWSPAFLSAAGLVLLALVGVVIVVRDRPSGSDEAPRPETWGHVVREVVISLRRPGTRLGFWSHFVTQSSGTVLTLLWGFPFMVYALGYPQPLAASLLIVIVVSGMIAGPILGVLTARFPYRRSNLVLGIVTVMGVAWAALLLWPGVPPMWLVIVLFVVVGVGGPGSLIGFDFARTFNPIRALGGANGIVNVGGFLASFVMMFLIGLIIDAVSGGSRADYSMDSFRIAFSVQYLVVGFGVAMLLVARSRTRRRFAEDEGIAVGPLWIAVRARLCRRR
ncbi:MFS transporter [Plantibacter cousiniae (nom. nud.)]|uniref:MFS transporter n=1 Tax=Plantibacter cousiniae (nom. nud.) TaxID=199709 RepID=UPI001E633FF8|nr:MFS transporter [Plantibacter cousiniae]